MSGRVQELGTLQAERRRSVLGELRVAVVLGDAGMGKTRLAAELLPRDDELAVGLTAHSTPFGGMPLFGLFDSWAQALGLHAGALHADGVCRACGSGLGGQLALARRAGIMHDASPGGEALRHHFVEWLPDLLAKASADRPIVVVLDDVHHGDEAVWEMLLRLAWDFPASRLFVLATARPAELARHRMAAEVLHALEQKAMVCRVQLVPFSREDVRELAAENLGRNRVPSALVDWLMDHAQGNPRCAVGLLETLSGNDADLQAPAWSGVPEKLGRWVRTEMARLDPPDRVLVEALAVVDDLIDPADLASIIGRPIEDVAITLERLVRSGMVVEQQHDRFMGYQVVHPLTQEVLYTDIGGARRRLMHRRAAEALLDSGRTEAAVSHFVRAAQAGDGGAIDALIEMVRHAEQHGLCSQVWRIVSRLQDLLPIGDKRWLDMFDALFQQTDRGMNWGIVDRTEHHVADIAAVRRMRLLLAGVADLHRQVDVRLWLAGLFTCGAGDLDAGERECRQALALCQRTGDEAAARTVAIELAKIRGWNGDLRGEERAARQLLSAAERAGDQRAIAAALAALGYALGWQGRFDAAEDALIRGIGLATAAARYSWASQNLALLASLDACRGDLVSARTRWAQAVASSPHYDLMVGGCGAFIELVAGDLPMAAAHARQWCSPGASPGGSPAAHDHDPSALSGLPVRHAGRAALAAAERGRLTEARRHLDVMRRTDSRTLGVLEPLYWWAEGVLARAEGRLAAAATALQRTVDCYAAMNAWALSGFALADLAEASVAVADSDTAARAAAAAEDNARRTGTPIHQALHLLATAWALVGSGRRDLAARAALQAMNWFDSSGYALLAARARVAYADAVRRSDRGASVDALRQAIAAFEACGAVVRRDQARPLLAQLESPGRCTAEAVRGPESLTGRERQVAELAAGGYTAPQIAARLHIGVRTVETHLARSYVKLGVTSKQQLVVQGAELGLAPGR